MTGNSYSGQNALARCTRGRHWVKPEEILMVNGVPLCPTCPPKGKQTQLRLKPKSSQSRAKLNNGMTGIAIFMDTVLVNSVSLSMRRETKLVQVVSQ